MTIMGGMANLMIMPIFRQGEFSSRAYVLIREVKAQFFIEEEI